MALTTVTVHGEILAPDGLTPAVGEVRFRTLFELRDTVANVVYAPDIWTAVLDINGEFTIVLPATDNPDVTPLDWSYQVFVGTDVWRETFFIQLPFTVGTVEFADLIEISSGDGSGCTPDGTACAPISILADIEALEAALDGKVNRSGDTMTGDLTIQADLFVDGDGNFGLDVNVGENLNVTKDGNFTQSVNVGTNLDVNGDSTLDGDLAVAGDMTLTITGSVIDIDRAIVAAQSTCVLFGGDVTVNVDPAKVDISAMTGVVVDYDSIAPASPTNPMITNVNYPGVTALTPSFTPFTYFMVNSAGVLVQQAFRPTPTQRRQNIILGLSFIETGVVVVDLPQPVIPSQLNNQWVDLVEDLKPFIVTGSMVSPNGANLQMTRTAGIMFARAFNQSVPTYLDPHHFATAAQVAMKFRHVTSLVGSATAVTATLDVANYDPSGLGVITAVGGGPSTATTFRIFSYASTTIFEQTAIQYGQKTYATLAAAVADIPAGDYVLNPTAVSGAFLGWLSVTRTATDLSDPTQAVFTRASRFSTP